MNLADLAEHICASVRKEDSDSVAICKDYLKRRDRMLWDKHLWRDSIFEFTLALDPKAAFNIHSNPILAASGIVLVPRAIDCVLGARTASACLPVQNMENYFRSSLDAFAQTGEPLEFNLLRPVVWQFDEPQKLWIYNAGEAVAAAVRIYDTATGEFGTATVDVTSTPQIVQPRADVVPDVQTIEEVTKPASAANVTLAYGADIAALTAFRAILAAETRLEKYQRIQLLPVPTAAVTLRLLVKQKYEELASDYQEPRLRQAENVLIALAMGDMFVRSGQIGASEKFYAEGLALLQQMANVEFHQQAQRMRLVPAAEYDPLRDRGFSQFSGKGYW